MYTTNTSQNAVNGSFRDRFTKIPTYWPSTERQNFASTTKHKYNHYEREGKAIFTVTLSTYVSSEMIAKSDRMRRFWEREFLYRITEQLPYRLKAKIDFDYVIERSTAGHYHYHGLLAMPKEAGDRIWKDGNLNRQLDRDLAALHTKGSHRDFAVNSFLMEPIRPDKTIDHWVHYMTKTHDYVVSSH